ncbi:MAG: SCO family protein, partial [Ekhidna sp.]|nr:SCO family protein [Ekhidna sp.]
MKKLILLLVLIVACSQLKKEELLPIYGNTTIDGNDTIYHTIKDFQLMDQDSIIITNESIADKIYVADFFFTSCPTICPAMKAQMLRVHEKFESNEDFIILSHTI